MKKITMKTRQAKELNKLITANKKALKAGSEITEATLCAWFGIVPTTPFDDARTVQKANMHKLSAYTTLNRQLAKRGLVIKASNYYTSFKVLSVEDTQDQIDRLSAVAASKSTRASILREGAKTYRSKWTKLKKSEI